MCTKTFHSRFKMSLLFCYKIILLFLGVLPCTWIDNLKKYSVKITAVMSLYKVPFIPLFTWVIISNGNVIIVIKKSCISLKFTMTCIICDATDQYKNFDSIVTQVKFIKHTGIVHMKSYQKTCIFSSKEYDSYAKKLPWAILKLHKARMLQKQITFSIIWMYIA